jgi:hypothetical protein
MAKYLRSLIIVFFACFCVKTYAQEAIHIGILPFDAADNNAHNIKDLVQQQVTSCFANKGRFFLLDRAVTEKLKNELERVKETSSAYAKIVADQGHQANAEFLITGKVNSMVPGTSTTTNYLGKKTTTYHATLHLSLQINTVETGKVYNQEAITVTSREFENDNPGDIFDNALCKLKVEIQKKVRNLFASSITIVGVDKEKNGVLQKVIVNAGKEIFENGKNSNCDGTSTIAAIFASKKVYLDVFTVEDYKYGNITSKRERKVGELKIDEVQGDITVCTVTKGDKELKTYMDQKKTLIVKTQ